jgi:hypothetical protein
MKNEEALQIIKTVIDESIKKGVIQNIDTAVKIAEAFNFIVKQLIEIKE